jgi:hypothetical protein
MTIATAFHGSSVAKSLSRTLALGRHGRRARRYRTRPKVAHLFHRIFQRTEPTTFQRCLAVHMHYARQPSALE